ncbi:hypothetical protein KCP69_11510 [Salmonella enterica subsp. enterica]|nr:hypothetical protein KCP69_11510 [Salmonella enterica subsp. enterica]
MGLDLPFQTAPKKSYPWILPIWCCPMARSGRATGRWRLALMLVGQKIDSESILTIW